MADEPRSESQEEPELSSQEAIVVEHVLAGDSVNEIADLIGRSVKQVYVVRQRPHVKAAIADGLRGGLEQARAELAANAREVASALTGIAKGGQVIEGVQVKPDAVQVQAAKAVLEYAIKLGEFAGDGAPKKTELAVTSGVFVLPQGPQTAEEWEKQHGAGATPPGDEGSDAGE